MAVDKGKTKRLPPSRLRYLQAHPAITIRVPRDLYNRLVEHRAETGLSFAQILEIGAGILQTPAIALDDRLKACSICKAMTRVADLEGVCADCAVELTSEYPADGSLSRFFD